jgi:hypothetical protein
VIDAREKLTGLIRHAIEDEVGLELVTSRGNSTPRGGYDTTFMFVQDGTATAMTIEVAWYPDSANFILVGPAVDRADEAVWTAHGLYRGRQLVDHGPLQCLLFVPYADGSRVDQLLGIVPALVAPYHAEATAAHARGARKQAQQATPDPLREDLSSAKPSPTDSTPGAPKIGGVKARKPGRPRLGRQVPPRARAAEPRTSRRTP